MSIRIDHSSNTNNRASYQQVKSFLDEVLEKVRTHDWYLRLDRDKNKDALYELDLTTADIEDFLLKLQPQDYFSGPEYDTKPYRKLENPGPLWAFGTMADSTEVYVKLRVGALGSKAICVSFHPSNPDLVYPLR